MSLTEIFGKKYKLAKSDHFEEYLKELAVPFAMRKLSSITSPVVDLHKEDDEYVLTSISTFKNISLRFKPGVEFDQETPDGRKVRATITIDGNTLHEVQTGSNGKVTTIDRTFTADGIRMVMVAGEITATRTYTILNS